MGSPENWADGINYPFRPGEMICLREILSICLVGASITNIYFVTNCFQKTCGHFSFVYTTTATQTVKQYSHWLTGSNKKINNQWEYNIPGLCCYVNKETKWQLLTTKEMWSQMWQCFLPRLRGHKIKIPSDRLFAMA